MIEIRWAVPQSTTTEPRVLQVRAATVRYTTTGVIGLPVVDWGDWQNVPVVVVDEAMLKAREVDNG